MLDKEVDESYYLSEERIATFEAHKRRNEAKGNHFGWRIRTEDDTAVSVTCQPDRYCANWIDETDDEEKGRCIKAGDLKDHDYAIASRVYSPEGSCPSILVAHESRPRILESAEDCIQYPTNNKKGYIEAYDGDAVILARPKHARGTVQSQKCPTLTTGTGCDTETVVKTNHGLRIRYLTPDECWRLMGFPDGAIDKARATGISKTQLYKQAGNSIVVPVLEAIFREIYQPTKNIQQMSLWDF